jgi:multimeric flavodoxin WrbA
VKVALINGSPKPRGSASAMLLDGLRACLPAGLECVECPLHAVRPAEDPARLLLDTDALVLACPVYVDGLPAHLLTALEGLEAPLRRGGHGQRVYALVNCGFYEGAQTVNALDMLRCWSGRAGLIWGRGMGVGAGGALHALKKIPMGEPPKAALGEALAGLAADIAAGDGGPHVFSAPELTREEHCDATQRVWRRLAAANGLTEEDLNKTEFT